MSPAEIALASGQSCGTFGGYSRPRLNHRASNLSSDDSPSFASSSNRNFGFVFCAFFLLLGCAPLWRGGTLRFWAVGAAIVIGLLAMIRPRWLTWPNRIWTEFGLLLHKLTSPIALGLIYVIGIIPVGIALRLLGQDPLRLKSRSNLDSYWIHRTPPGRPDMGMKNQF